MDIQATYSQQPPPLLNITAESLIKKWTPHAIIGIIQALATKTKTLCRKAKFLKH
jgi:hypothetical protein